MSEVEVSSNLGQKANKLCGVLLQQTLTLLFNNLSSHILDLHLLAELLMLLFFLKLMAAAAFCSAYEYERGESLTNERSTVNEILNSLFVVQLLHAASLCRHLLKMIISRKLVQHCLTEGLFFRV